ncbi:MAG: Translation elongation factor 1 beta [Thelocarpon superellum]|nr:MAG: Translation elongation factor 1 beta [Thelocarpon superellum]
MGFTDFVSDAGFTLLNHWLTTRSYIHGYSPSQADVVTFKALKGEPTPAKFPHAYRWYKHIATYESEFSSLPGDPSKPHTSYGPDASAIAVHPAKAAAKDDDDDMDLFGSSDEEEDAEAVRIREKNLEEYRKKKAAKGAKPAAKSMVTMDIKPWDDETDMKELEANVRVIEMDGLIWSASKLVPVGFGIKKLQINLVVEDDKVSIDELQAKIEEDEDHVQSTDIAAMQKL